MFRTIHTLKLKHLRAHKNHTNLLYTVEHSLVLSVVLLPRQKMSLLAISPGTRKQQICQVCTLKYAGTWCVFVCVTEYLSECVCCVCVY